MKNLVTIISIFCCLFATAQEVSQKEEKCKDESEYYLGKTVKSKACNKSKKNNVYSYDGGFPQNIVIEEATGTWCGYCPRGIVMLDYIRQNYSDRIFPIAVHKGDEMEIAEYKGFINEYVAGFPAAFANRIQEVDISNNGADNLYDNIKDQTTYASVSMSAKVAGNTLVVDATTEFAIDIDMEHRLSFVVVEDGVGPYFQTNNYGEGSGLGTWDTAGSRVLHEFNDVAREIKTYEGIEGSLPYNLRAGNKYSYSTEINLSNLQSSTFRVIAMIINKESGEIVNSTQYTVTPEGTIYLDKSILNLSIGEQNQLTAYIGGSEEKVNNVEWSSFDTSIATVDETGIVTACGEGTTVISASCPLGVAECQVNVSLHGSICVVEGIRYKIKDELSCMVALPENGKRYEMEKINIPSEIEAFGRKFVVDELEWGGFVGVFNRCPNLVEVTLPNTISVIPGDTFEYCQQLTTVNLPSSIQFIDAYAFTGCNSLSHIDLKEGLTGLWTWTFAWCTNLKDIELPSTLENMGREIFYNTPLERIHCKAPIPPILQGDLFNEDKNSEDYYNCALIVPETSIEAYKTADYWKNFDIIVPDYVILNKYRLTLNPTESYQLSVINCNASDVVWSSGDDKVVKVDSYGNVTGIDLGETTVKAECNGKFIECKITVSMEGHIAESEGIYYRITSANTCSVTRPTTDEGYQQSSITIPNQIDFEGRNYTVTEMDYDVFNHCLNLVEIHLPNSLTEISSGAFYGCENLLEITIPSSVKRISSNAFSFCTNLSQVNLNEGLVELEYRSFACSPNLRDIVLPSSLEKIEQETFFETNLDRIYSKANIPPALDGDLFNTENISENYNNCALIVPESSMNAYRNAEYWKNFDTILSEEDLILNKIVLSLNPNDTYKLTIVDNIDQPTVWKSKNDNIATVDTEGNVTAISVGNTVISAQCGEKTAECRVNVSMKGCSFVLDGFEYLITSDDTCEVVGRSEEHKNENEHVVIPSPVNLFGEQYIVTSIKESAFWEDPLRSIEMPNSIEIIKSYAIGACQNLERIELPNSISNIESFAFYQCSSLSEIKLPNTLSRIGGCAFCGCSHLEEITIPASVSVMEYYLFWGVPLKKLTMECLTPPEAWNDFFVEENSNQYEECELIVPEQSYDLYRNHPIFGKFSQIHTFDSGVEEILLEDNICNVYSIGGQLIAENVSADSVSDIALSGIFILHFRNGTIKKVVL